MKRMIFLLLVAALAVPSAFAQFVPGSMANGMTMGLFENEIDQAFQANGDFGKFTNNFLFAGLGNPEAGLATFGQTNAFDTTFTAPVKLGYYMAGSMPISFYSSMDFTPLTGGLIGRHILGTTTTNTPGATATVTSGTTFTDYEWVSQSTVDVSTDVIRANTWQADIQALTKLGPAVVGLYLYMDADNSNSDVIAADTRFIDRTQTFNVNTAALTAIPVVVQDYTIIESIKNVNPAALPGAGGSGSYQFLDSFRVGVPFAMRTGNIEHRAFLDLNFASTDSSGAYTSVQSAHAQNVGAASNNDVTLAVTDKTTTTNINASYGLRIPAGSAGNEWRAGILLNVALNGQEYSYDDVLRPYNLSVLNTKTALTGGSHIVATATYAAGLDILATLSGARVFAFEPAKGIAFRFEPSVSLGVGSNSLGAAKLTGSTAYTAPLDAAGAVNAAVAYNTTTIAVTGNPANLFILGVGASLPMGVTIKPADWKFGILLGATPNMSVASLTTTSSGETTTQTVVNTTGATVNSTTITTPIINTPNATSTMSYVFTENHYIGVTVPFDGGVHFDARLNLSLLDFESFTIQAFIPFK